MVTPARTPGVTRTQALQIAKEMIKKRLHILAVDANLHDHYRANYPAAKNAAKERDQLREVLIVLERIKNEI